MEEPAFTLEQQFRFCAFQERIRGMDAKQLRILAVILFAQQISAEATIDRVMAHIDDIDPVLDDLQKPRKLGERQ